MSKVGQAAVIKLCARLIWCVPVSSSDLLMLSDRSVAGVRITRVDHPGEYPGRYY